MLDMAVEAYNDFRATDTFKAEDLPDLEREYALVKSVIDGWREDDNMPVAEKEDALKKLLKDIVDHNMRSVRNPILIDMTQRVRQKLGLANDSIKLGK